MNATASMTSLGEYYLLMRAQWERADEAAKKAKELKDEAEKKLLSYMIDAAHLTSFKTAAGVQFTAKISQNYSCKAADRPRLMALLEEDGMRDMFTVNPRTLSGWAKEQAEQNEGELPERYAFIDCYEAPSLSVTGRKRG